MVPIDLTANDPSSSIRFRQLHC